MYVGIHLKPNELTEQMLKTIKKVFKDEEVHFFVEGRDETEYLLSSKANQKMLDKSIEELEAGKLTEFSLDELLCQE